MSAIAQVTRQGVRREDLPSSHLPDRIVVCTVLADNSTNNSAVITAALARITALTPAVTNRCKLVIRGVGTSLALFATPFQVPLGCDYEQQLGLRLTYSGSDRTVPAVIIGNTSTTAVDKVDVKGFHLEHNGWASFKQWAVADGGSIDPDHFCGLRISNQTGARVEIIQSFGFAIGVQLLPYPGSNVAHSTFIIRDWLINNRVAIDIRGNTSSGYSNENRFEGPGNIGPSGSWLYGSMYAIRFSAESGGYAGNNNNIFHGLCYQMGGSPAHSTFSASAVVAAGDVVTADAREYVVTTAGTMSGSAPTHTTGSDTNGTATLKYLGRFRRSVILNDQAGNSNHVDGGRLETSYGPMVISRRGTDGQPVGRNTTVDLTLDLAGATDANPTHGYAADHEVEMLVDSPISQALAESYVRFRGVLPYEETFTLANAHRRAVIGASGCYIPGYAACRLWGVQPSLASYRAEAVVILTKYGLYHPGTDHGFCILVPVTDDAPVVHVAWNAAGSTTPPVFSFGALDEDLALLAVSAAPYPIYAATGFASDSVLPFGSQQFAGNTAIRAVAACSYLMVAFRTGVVSDVTITRMKRATRAALAAAPCVYDQYAPLAGPRMSAGAPTAGVFSSIGERIFDLTSTTIWRVTTAGVLAPAWVTATVVIEGEYRSNAGHVYSAAAAGTTGATTPVHTSGSVSDGTVTWDYVGPIAVLT